jgi:acyl dehydratase
VRHVKRCGLSAQQGTTMSVSAWPRGGVATAILNAVVAEKLPGPGTVFLEAHWRFLAPTRPGDTTTGEVEVTSVREDKPITTLTTRVLLGDGTISVDGTAVCWTMQLG